MPRRCPAARRLCRVWLVLPLALLLAACATPHVQRTDEAMTLPALLPDHVRAEDGVRLPLSVWLPEGRPRGVVLGLHGFNDYRRAFEEVGEGLVAQGIAVYAFDQRGFGETERTGLWYGGERMARDARAVAGLLREHHAGVPLYLLGESMGGAVALLALADAPTRLSDGLVLLAPAVWGRSTMPVLQRGALWLAAHLFPDRIVSPPKGLNIRPTDNPEARRKLREDPLVIKATRVDALWGIAELMDQALLTSPPPGLPTLILYGERDEIIPKRPTCRWLAGLPAEAPIRLAVYPEGWHMLTRDLQAATVLADLAAWLTDPAGHLPSGVEVAGRQPHFCG